MSAIRPAAVVVLAAGEGTRMKSATPKVLHEICGRSLVGHVLAAARELNPENLVVVVGHAREQVTAHLAEVDAAARTAVQEKQKGTGHAVRMGLEELGGSVEGTVIVVCGDTPLLTAGTLRDLAAAHAGDGNAVTVLTAEVPDATGYGRIVRDAETGAVTAIVEHKDATEAERAIREINSGVFAFDGRLLADALGKVRTNNSQGEEYLTDVLGILREAGHRVGASVAGDHREIAGINNRVQLAEARRILNDRLLTAAMLSGVTVVDPATTWVDVTVTFEQDVTVLPGTQLHGATHLAAGSVVGPNSRLTDTKVGAGARVDNTVSDGAVVGPEASVGPYAYLRPGTRLGLKSKVGTYVETKNARIGEGTKVPHLSYVGDATIGEYTNIGAASVFVNYDGQDKHHTTVGSHCRTGSDNMFVAPVTIGDGAYTAAGSVITKNVPPGSLAVARGQQRNIEGWVARKRPGSAAAKAAEAATPKAEGEA
ncbi:MULTISPECIES: bifunctional UDP-N-acetylglucosamine diphosphorylase/glucosamine-1-phosphate N-acetyltransferase GlmU [Streptomyces]|uniref:bifunctional UDP-N-acetylglucosamine diphosphorylase/glucosamine-1-phosphate N-acetyltransferase GlmU n=1 Tax=Streptomyces TaxID=1883 RepID=UPI0001D05A8D|nr:MULTISPECIES: bifunctional UDP-N-acetylglucosamine diphosphorylase/glucosamine-1-phosphate N-acetyltransferase GlmU [Streptomyces]MYS41911.1 bifunctional UDP-N-acetylglucosamine diphosphorylase/glucosamine-1-phosphate N-acetyltransferase GlmU [Streptomyces sp. SID5998]MYX40229.1 bifunctional UDP-N-acetylglucosamine diphosphorylase/glucosamine-1-phosphate N-acetyltransferase GlmU [Streptomyces sp. SID89]NED76215.1 bifunctional UDP-N-acetylglucosamine diphosphorylase/glucosamine-1-phosphate N-a